MPRRSEGSAFAYAIRAQEEAFAERIAAVGPPTIAIDLSLMAFVLARRVLGHLPRAARTEERLVAFHAYIYDALIEAREHRPLDERVLAQYEQIMVDACKKGWRPQSEEERRRVEVRS